MKKLVLAAALALGFLQINAQDNFTVKMSFKIEGLPEEYAGMAENDIVTYMKGDKSKTEVTSMMMSQIIVNDGEVSTTLMEQMGNKTGWTMTKAEMEAEEKEANAKKTKPTIEYTTEKKTIAGYECTKAIVTSVSGKEKKEVKTIVWYTEKLKQPSTAKSKGKRGGMMGGPDLTELKGFPMQTEMTANNQGMDMKMISTVTEVSTAAIDDAVFKVSTDGYKMMTYKELKEQMKKESAE
jgi:hypothetical protein